MLVTIAIALMIIDEYERVRLCDSNRTRTTYFYPEWNLLIFTNTTRFCLIVLINFFIIEQDKMEKKEITREDNIHSIRAKLVSSNVH